MHTCSLVKNVSTFYLVSSYNLFIIRTEFESLIATLAKIANKNRAKKQQCVIRVNMKPHRQD